MSRRHLVFRGCVQGVGFRYRALHAARLYGVTGWVRNEWDGSVTMELQGPGARIDQVILAVEKGTFIHIENMSSESVQEVDGERDFRVV